VTRLPRDKSKSSPLQNCSLIFTGATIGVYKLRGTKKFRSRLPQPAVTKHGYYASSLRFDALLGHACDTIAGNAQSSFDREHRRTLAEIVPTTAPANIDRRDCGDE
jgi:hypothetical protein